LAKEKRSLTDTVVAITGGARGIGKATAEALASRGAKVAIGDLDLELADRTAAEIGRDTIALRLDVTERQSFEAFLAQVEERLGPLDVLVNNAGIMPIGPFTEEDDATAQRMIDINLHGVIFGTKLALERMLPRDQGHIVNVASVAGKAGFPAGATYCATKHAVVGLTEALDAELDETGVSFSVVMPAVVNTELADGLEESRGVRKVEPTDVAEATVEALQTGRFEVWIPRSTDYIGRVIRLLPRRGRLAIGRALKADQVLAGADFSARAAYEDRAAHSEPGLEPEGEPTREGSGVTD
jgi:NAD(P)-dependent dehydrogenase (short-subunit alcohol dehydrogenase family)